MTTRPCEWCGKPVQKPRSGPWGRFCSDMGVRPGTTPCRVAWHAERNRQERLRALEGRVCEVCGEPIRVERNALAKRCGSPRCTAKAQYAATKADPERLARHNEKLKLLQRRKYASMTPPESAARSVRRREQDGAARARQAGAPVEDIDILRDIVRVQGIHCYICGGRTALVLGGCGGRSPLGISIDHVVPLEHGGGHTINNCRVSHHGCNSRKQDRSLDWARERSERRDAPAPTVAQLYTFMGALALTSDGQGVLLDPAEGGDHK